MTPTEQYLAQVRERLEKATPDWDVSLGKFHDDPTWPGNFDVNGGMILSFGMDGEEGIYANNAVDVQLIANAPTDLARLLKMVETQAAFIKSLSNGIMDDGDHVDTSVSLNAELILELCDQIAKEGEEE